MCFVYLYFLQSSIYFIFYLSNQPQLVVDCTIKFILIMNSNHMSFVVFTVMV